jgi:hypothetical protein
MLAAVEHRGIIGRRAIDARKTRCMKRLGCLAMTAALLCVGLARAELPQCTGKVHLPACKEPTRWVLLPVIGYEPESSWMFGGYLQRYFDSPRSTDEKGHTAADKPRRSVWSLFALGTLKEQFVIETAPTLYLDDGRWRISAVVNASLFPDNFWAIGVDSPEDSREPYTVKSLAFTPTLERRLVSDLYLGWTGQFAIWRMETEPGGALASGAITGSQGGEVLGMGPVVAWDDRDRDSSPRKGGRYQFSMLTYPRWFGTDFAFGSIEIDLRRFLSLSPRQVLALQYYSKHTGGSVPFLLLPRLGGNGHMRGFVSTRYVDRHTLSMQVDYRVRLFWLLGGVLFLSTGDVAHRIGEFDPSAFKVAGGFGLRLAVNDADGVNLRFDSGWTSDGGQSFYLSVGEAF